MAPLRRSYDANHFAAPASLIAFASSGKPALSRFALPLRTALSAAKRLRINSANGLITSMANLCAVVADIAKKCLRHPF